MSELLTDNPSIAAAGADPGRRKAAANEANGAPTVAVTSTPAATPIAVGAGESDVLRVLRFEPSEPSIEYLKLGTA
jgi:hypothetical protein